MKFPLSMLRDFVQTSLDADAVGDLLTMAGFELEGIEVVEGEPVLDIKVCSNRGDGLSVFGLAREVLAKDASAKATDLYRAAVAGFPMAEVPAGSTSLVSIETPMCTRYAAMTFSGVKNGAAQDWIQLRLRQAGMRPISLIVDLTNYVMLELGQPMHAFDQATLKGGRIVVRMAKPGEKMATLDGTEHELAANHMMICDAERPVAVAGVMGGLDTEVSDSTTEVLLESAHFVNTSVRKTRKQLGLSTEASYRFERSVDPEGVVAAQRRFAQLLGATPTSLVDMYPSPPKVRTLALRISRAVRLLGMEVGADEARGYLERLGMKVEGDGEPFTVTVPTWRPDLEREDDLVEEIGRVHGYERIPEQLPQGSTPQGGVFGFEEQVDRLRSALVDAGLVQIISHSLRDRHPLDADGERCGPRNPASPEMAFLRNSLLPCLADAARRNGGKDVHLFEIGRVFVGAGGAESMQASVLSHGALQPGHWRDGGSPNADFFSLKGMLLEALPLAGLDAEHITFKPSNDHRFHPTRQATVIAYGVPAGVMGELHPDLVAESGLGAAPCAAELSVEALFQGWFDSAEYRIVSRNPAVRRDIAIAVDKAVAYAQISRIVAEAAGEVLERQWLFDVYEGKGVAEGQHSLSIAMQLRKAGSNFTDEEANQVRDRVVAALGAVGATQR